MQCPARLRLQPLETRDVPTAVPLLAFGADAGAAPRLLVVNKDTGAVRFDVLAFGPQFRGGVRVAVGDVTGDGQDDAIAATGPGVVPVVKVFNGANGRLVSRFAAATPAVTQPRGGLLRLRVGPAPCVAGVTVAAGDLNGDGRLEVITGYGPGGPAVIAAYDGRNRRTFGWFVPPGLGTAGARVAAGDVTGDGRAEILVTPAGGSGSTVRVFDGRSHALIANYRTMTDVPHRNGLFVAAADVDGDGAAEAVVGAGTGATVEVHAGRAGALVRSLIADVPAVGGVRVGGTVFGAGGKADIVCGSADTASWAAYDGSGTALPGGHPDGFPTGLWVAGGPEQAAINRHAAQVVVDWNAAALDAIRTEKTPPPKGSRALAILQAAVFDAVNGIARGYHGYLARPPRRSGRRCRPLPLRRRMRPLSLSSPMR